MESRDVLENEEGPESRLFRRPHLKNDQGFEDEPPSEVCPPDSDSSDLEATLIEDGVDAFSAASDFSLLSLLSLGDAERCFLGRMRPISLGLVDRDVRGSVTFPVSVGFA